MMRSLKSRVIAQRRAHELIHEFILTWQLDCVASVGASPGVGAVPFGYASIDGSTFVPELDTTSSQWVDVTSDEPCAVRGDVFGLGAAAGEINLVLSDSHDGLGRAHLMTLAAADSALSEAADRAASTLYQQVMAKASATPRANFRKWCAYRRCKRRLAALFVLWREKLVQACYPQRTRRRGLQRVSARLRRRKRLRAIPAEGWFQFNGRVAYRARVGRPPLSEAEWLRRYAARLRKRRGRGKARPGRQVKVPSLPSGRPRPARTWSSPKGRDTRHPRNLFLGQHDPAAQADDWFSPADLDPVLIAGDFPDMSGQV